MNEEIKKELRNEYLNEFARSNGKKIEPSFKDADGDVNPLWQWIDQKLKEQYLQGARDMREAVKIEDMAVADFDGTNSTEITMRVGYNMALRHTKRQAQQFIDSLENNED